MLDPNTSPDGYSNPNHSGFLSIPNRVVSGVVQTLHLAYISTFETPMSSISPHRWSMLTLTNLESELGISSLCLTS